MEGKGNRTNASEPLENADIKKMWSVGVLGDNFYADLWLNACRYSFENMLRCLVHM